MTPPTHSPKTPPLSHLLILLILPPRSRFLIHPCPLSHLCLSCALPTPPRRSSRRSNRYYLSPHHSFSLRRSTHRRRTRPHLRFLVLILLLPPLLLRSPLLGRTNPDSLQSLPHQSLLGRFQLPSFPPQPIRSPPCRTCRCYLLQQVSFALSYSYFA